MTIDVNEARVRHDTHREVRIRVAKASVRRIVAQRIDAGGLAAMAIDADAEVRLEVARRLPPHQLLWLSRDKDCRVRYEVAERIATQHLPNMLGDCEPMVCEAAHRRLGTVGSKRCVEGNP